MRRALSLSVDVTFPLVSGGLRFPHVCGQVAGVLVPRSLGRAWVLKPDSMCTLCPGHRRRGSPESVWPRGGG